MLKPGTEVYIETGEHDTDTGLPVLELVKIQRIIVSYETLDRDNQKQTVEPYEIKGLAQ